LVTLPLQHALMPKWLSNILILEHQCKYDRNITAIALERKSYGASDSNWVYSAITNQAHRFVYCCVYRGRCQKFGFGVQLFVNMAKYWK